MKKLKFVWIFIALMLGSTIVFAQGWRNGRCINNYNGEGQWTCVNVLSDITDEQKEKISELETAHQKAMAELRVDMRSTNEPLKKNEIRGEMIKKVQTHRNEVRNLLTEEQQKQYDLLQTVTANRGRRIAAARGGGRGQAGFGRRGFRGGW